MVDEMQSTAKDTGVFPWKWCGLHQPFVCDFLIKAFSIVLHVFNSKPSYSVPLIPFQFLIVCKYDGRLFWMHTRMCLIKDLVIVICPIQVMNYETKRDNGCEKVCIISILTIHQVNISNAGNLTCTGINKAGKNSVTAVLKVVGMFLHVVYWFYSNFICEIGFKLWSCCLLSDKPYIKLKPILSSEYNVNGSDIEVMQGDTVELALQIEAYPEVKRTSWKTPKSNHTHEETFNMNNNRLVHLFLSL